MQTDTQDFNAAPTAAQSAPVDSHVLISPHDEMTIPGSQPLPDARYESMCTMRLRGIAKYICYQRVINPEATKLSASKLASDIFHRPEVSERMSFLYSETKKDDFKPIDNAELRRVLAVIVRSGCPNERIAASKQLRDWIREDTERTESERIADPALVAERCNAYHRHAPETSTLQGAAYCTAIRRGMPELPLEAWIESINQDRADAPPIQQISCNPVDIQQDTQIIDNKTASL